MALISEKDLIADFEMEKFSSSIHEGTDSFNWLINYVGMLKPTIFSKVRSYVLER